MAVTPPVIHADQIGIDKMVGQNLNLAIGTGLLLNANVGGSNTEALMEAATVANAAPLHAEFQGFVGRINRAYQYGANYSLLTTANIQGASVATDLPAATSADPNKKGGPIAVE